MPKENAGVFKPWVPNWLAVFVLFFCLLHCMVLLGVYMDIPIKLTPSRQSKLTP